MKKPKKILIILFLILLMTIFTCQKAFAFDKESFMNPVDYTEEFKNYLKLSEEERKKVLMPNPYNIKRTTAETKNPFKLAKMLGAGITDAKYSLQSDIPENIIVKNQGKTSACWSFASLASLETTLALQNYKSQIAAKTYDFSERHMIYSSTRDFANSQANIYGYNRGIDDGGSWYLAKSYLTNGLGAINEADMPFDENLNTIDISQIQNKDVQTRVYDTVEFPKYSVTEDTTQIKQKIKEHIKNTGAVYAGIHGAKLNSDYCNLATGAIYCNNEASCPMDHAVVIIGWDDDYSIDNFNSKCKPQNNGAWIIKNSWGQKYELVEEIKQQVFDANKAEFEQAGITQVSQLTDDMMVQLFNTSYGWTVTIENNKFYVQLGNNGIMYVSYDDVNIYNALAGIEKATDTIDYENIYQYNETTALGINYANMSKIYMANVFSKKTTGTEYITRSCT